MIEQQKFTMLWLDNNPKLTSEEKLVLAKEHFVKKYGKEPVICFVNKSMFPEEKTYSGMEVKITKMVMPNHFMIGWLYEKAEI